MYRFTRTARIKDGKGPEARQWAKTWITYMNEKYPGNNWEAGFEVFGTVNTVHFTGTLAELTDWDPLMAKYSADTTWQALSDKHVEYYIDGSMHDTLIRLV